MLNIKILGSVCVRGGSKGVRNKNLKLLNGKPLIAYSIESLLAWGKAERVVVSTDSKELQKIAKEYGAEVPFTRPAELATDTAGKLEVQQHLVDFCEKQENSKYDYYIDLDATSPLRTIKDIDEAFNRLLNSNADLITSCYKAEKNPYFNMVEIDEDGYSFISKKSEISLIARQQAPKVYSLNASIWIFRRDFLMKTSHFSNGKMLIYEMSDYSIDIDRPIDFDFIEFILKKKKFKFDI